MADGRWRPGRHLRTLRTFVDEHRRTLAVDVAVLTVWALLLVALVVLARFPREVLYAGLFAGVVSYSLLAGWRESDGGD